MNEISCEVCMDLIPLVLDGAASGGSRETVERHIRSCPACRSLWEGETIPCSEGEQVLPQMVKRVQTVSMVIFVAMLLMGIVACEWIMQGSSVFFLGAVWAAWKLLRIAAAKDKGLLPRLTAFLAAGVILVGIGWLANAVLGNPVEKSRAEKAARDYLEEKYPELELEIGEISYATSSSTYDVKVVARADTSFEVVYRRGEILYDTYGEMGQER